jgi:hypothetical protein
MAARATLEARWSSWRGNAVEPIIRDALAIAAGAGQLPWSETWEVGAADLIWGPDNIVQAWSA